LVPADASSDTTSAEDVASNSDAGPTACPHPFVPKTPSVLDAGGDIDFSVAISWINYRDRVDANNMPTYGTLGFHLCPVCPEAPYNETPSCVRGANAAQEGIDGRDNGTGGILSNPLITGYAGNSVGSVVDTNNIKRGNFTVILRVQGYNGQADDDQVSLQ